MAKPKKKSVKKRPPRYIGGKRVDASGKEISPLKPIPFGNDTKKKPSISLEGDTRKYLPKGGASVPKKGKKSSGAAKAEKVSPGKKVLLRARRSRKK